MVRSRSQLLNLKFPLLKNIDFLESILAPRADPGDPFEVTIQVPLTISNPNFNYRISP
jgi:hypothetical protein